MIIWCLKNKLPSIKFYEKMGKKIVSSKTSVINTIQLEEIGLAYDLLKKNKGIAFILFYTYLFLLF